MIDRLLPRCRFPAVGTTVDCAFSGGADSTALLVLATAAGLVVTAHHVDHGLRPGSADEAEQARSIAERLGVTIVVHRVDPGPGPNLEARARAARRAVLPVGALTGHTADDQAETLLIRLLRGAGGTGLSAMRPGSTKPLLDLRRTETVAVCASLGITPVIDPSNIDPAMWRNRVRHELLPLLADPSDRERDVFSHFTTSTNEACLHTDVSVLPTLEGARASWNYLLHASGDAPPVVTYDLNRLQRLRTSTQYCVTLNPDDCVDERHVLSRFVYHHPLYTREAIGAQRRWHEVSGVNRTHFCGAYWFYGFHEDGLTSAIRVAETLGVRW